MRVITALLLLPLVIGILFLPRDWFDVAIGLILVLSSWEYVQLIKLDVPVAQGLYVLLLTGFYFLGLFFPLPFLIAAALFWLTVSYWLTQFPKGEVFWKNQRWFSLLVGILLLCPAGIGLAVLHHFPQGWAWVLFVLLLVWAADIGAYFSGRLMGKRPLAPLISPKKTIEGAYGGLLAVVLVTAAYVALWHISLFKLPLFFVLIGLVFLLSVVGDLAESGIKRWMNVKDSGNLLPGHGGILDRIDSLLAAAPIFALGIWILIG